MDHSLRFNPIPWTKASNSPTLQSSSNGAVYHRKHFINVDRKPRPFCPPIPVTLMSSTLVPTPEEQAILTHIGTSVLVSILSAIVESCLWIIGVILFIWAMRVQISGQKSPTAPRVVLLTVSVYLFMSSTALWAMDLYWAIVGTKTYFLNVVEGVPLETITTIRKHYQSPLGLPMELLFLLNMIIGTLRRDLESLGHM
ncbi:hypothetical protein PM082_014303 [Marasmius tenuissimus]|nr:hypothetical protein PM082_014303 [Marasmius tenuissimus]